MCASGRGFTVLEYESKPVIKFCEQDICIHVNAKTIQARKDGRKGPTTCLTKMKSFCS